MQTVFCLNSTRLSQIFFEFATVCLWPTKDLSIPAASETCGERGKKNGEFDFAIF